ncbi:MAG: DUF4349 domain-containing protein [Brasilonema octagenarum HA4186-MV1]|jgi:ACT domain-containing protein|uniref:DUF4349 domain-containing protein n=1 Tax=Brasilonema octagenarum UFV-OR1 TaxID=417115 RepID=A0ABX1MA04_9CYAN|nr:DUF4349 domain-containing protein [Brasilonema octagenarum]MBW4626063.1 DUF4349 domain-containing protein [Brasilonema octagenarum HA4186-MV1]NMF65435.1 DUF4349 domain-containing protein [Brasilonema octagenarum UFV-OR1]
MSGLSQVIFSIRKPTLVLSVVAGGVILTSCASVPSAESTNQALPKAQINNQLADTAARSALTEVSETTSTTAQAAQITRPRQQLIKKAAITLIVDSVDKSIDAVSQIISQQQGDLIKLEEQQPKNESARHTATIQLRIPQNLLEPTLEKLTKLGSVQSRNITAVDVGDQIVDIQARLSNLRITESNLQKIMDRAGSVRDVLSVAKELSNVRQSIEQIDAQLKNLQNQVAYSTITLNIEAAVSGNAPQRTFGSQMQSAWNNSTHSLAEFTFGLVKMGIWLAVYSPYLLILAAASYGLTRWRRNNAQRSVSIPESGHSDRLD